jgi:hypothetical protein
VAPHIAAPIASEFATQTATAATVTAIAVNGSITEAAAKVIVAKAIICTASLVSSVAACLCISRKKTAG